MAARNRTNPLALAVLVCLYERPMHPYEIATTLRQRGKHESVRLNYGSLYSVVDSLRRRGLVVAKETERPGRLPERTIYGLTDAGRLEMADWLTELVSTPIKDYPSFEAALSFLPALPPGDVVALLEERAQRLEFELAAWDSTRELIKKKRLPRLLWIESDFHATLLQAEFQFVVKLAADIKSGALDGMEWWRQSHERGDGPVTPPPFDDGISPAPRQRPSSETEAKEDT